MPRGIPSVLKLSVYRSVPSTIKYWWTLQVLPSDCGLLSVEEVAKDDQ
jgi:hypothetical protein